MPKIAFVGNKDAVMGFKALGASVFPVLNATEGRGALAEISSGDYSVVFITEALAVELEHEIEELNQKSLPVVTTIPDNRHNLGLGMKHIRSQVERAVGVDILFKEEGVER